MKLTVGAGDQRRGMTLIELHEAVASAVANGADLDQVLKVRVSMGSTLRAVTLDMPPGGALVRQPPGSPSSN